MSPNSRFRKDSQSIPGVSSQNGRRRGATAVSARHILLSDSWTKQVAALEAAIGGLQLDGHSKNNCEVVFFEIPGDDHLHVNVTHKYVTKQVSGWAGPGSIPDGFVHSRTFGNTPPKEIMRHILDMVSAGWI